MTSSMKKKIKALIADDHEIIRKGIKTILSETEDIHVVGEAGDGNEVLKKISEIDVDVLVMDFDMPGKNGLETLAELKILHPKLPVIILSIFPEEHYGTRFLKAGASGYLGKASASALLVEAIRQVAKGGKFISPALAGKLVEELHGESDKPSHESLTDREFQVFRQLASGKKLKEIASELCLSINTVSTYRGRVLVKMNMQNNSDLIRYALENDLIK